METKQMSDTYMHTFLLNVLSEDTNYVAQYQVGRGGVI